MAGIYIGALHSIKGSQFMKREEGSGLMAKRARTNYAAGNGRPASYAHYQGTYVLEDWNGSLITGQYDATDGSTVNIITGEYRKANSEAGNIAIPASELGSVVVYTTNIPAMTITGTTTLSATTVSTVNNSGTISSLTPVTMTTRPTTLPPTTPTVTSAKSDSTSASDESASAALSTSSKSGTDHVSADSGASFGMSIFIVLMYAIYAL
ncbi:hypothetical protein GQ43DRAFT_435929 [Delitschia confertaspora ATCC 74209]|uniref:Uncharacterized protein n=1 Tax=Delitschia confertaspora ATCC 74209 TaxID=1513339 RepID=A0A9P4JDY1_9PLEO|nr:hypothetical protein GQ43DRAFT_435929 [Delitschia confertaspora ATCC 74209]